MSFWTDDRIKTAVQLLRVIARDVKRRQLPSAVYEALQLSTRGVSTELALFNGAGEIWLVKRPTRRENPAEPWPNEWNMPGVTHGPSESPTTALERLWYDELADIRVTPRFTQWFDLRVRRGRYIALLHVAQVPEELAKLSGRKARFFHPLALPRRMVEHHRDTLIPAAVGAWRRR